MNATDGADRFDPETYDKNEDGILSYKGVLQATLDNPAFAYSLSVLDGARYLYQDNDTRGEFYQLYDAFRGDDEPDVPDSPKWKRIIESSHEIDWNKYDVEDPDEDAPEDKYELPDIKEPDQEVDWSEVKEAILNYFDEDTLKVCEALATVPIQLMFDDFTDCPMVIVVGNASSGKTTALELFKGWDRIFTTHEVTPAAFVSHNTNQNDDELGEMDLLPKITDQVLWVPEMGTWFSGDDIERYMRTLSGVADGSGYVKSTGAQGSHGYDGEPGEYQFGLMGATTPPSPRAWSEMGNAGARVLMHGMPNTENDDELEDQIFGNGGIPYHEKKEIVREKIANWIRTLYHEHDGHIEMENEQKGTMVSKAIIKLAEIVARGRGVSYAKENDAGDLEGEVQIEDRKRVIQMLRFTARARATMDGRTQVATEDLQVCSRIAFATMPEKRRGMVKLLCDPKNGTTFTTKQVKTALDLGSKNTAKRRMQEVDQLGLAHFEEEGHEGRGGKADVVRLADEELMWLFSKDNEEKNPGPLTWPFK